MDNKSVIAIALVAVLVVAGIATFVLINNGTSQEKVDNSLDCRLRVLGNANQDNYLDDKDVQYIQDVIDGKKIWDRYKDPLVDANNDGVIDKTDITYVNNFVAGKTGTMYYLDQNGEVRSVPYPLTNVLGSNYGICTEWSTGLDMAIILGLEDKVTYMANSDVIVSDLDPALYPTISKIKSFGMRNPSLDTMWSDGVRIMMGDHPKGFGSYCDEAADLGFTIIKLPLNRAVNNVTAIDTLITLGAMYNAQDKTKPYIEFMDKVNEKLETSISKADVKALSYIIPYIAPSYESFWVDAHGSGPMTTADVVLLEKLPVISKITTTAADGFEEVTVDMLVNAQPDIFVSAMYVFAEDKNVSVKQYQDKFVEWMELGFDKSTAGKNGKLFAIPFETCSLAGYASIMVVASMIWPDAFNADEAWSLMQEYYDTFTHFSGDIKNSKFAPLSYSELKA